MDPSSNTICSRLSTQQRNKEICLSTPMAHKKARKFVPRKPTSTADAGASSSMGMAEMPDLLGTAAAVNNLNPPPLPHGVYFNPSPEESVGLLNSWIAGGKEIPAYARGFIFEADIYGNNPDALRQVHSPASSRAGQHAVPTWWFLGETKFQSPGAASKRADRKVETGGYWRLEQTKQKLGDEGGLKNCFGFYLGTSREHKTPWLMQEFTTDKDKGVGKKGTPALHKVYVKPRPTDDKVDPERVEKPVPTWFFDAVTARLQQESVRGLEQQHVDAPQELPPPPSPVAMPAHVLGQYQQQQGQYIMGAAPPPPTPAPAGLPDDDNLSMPMGHLMAILEEPAETVKGEPEWTSLTDIVDHDEFARFNN